MRRWADETAWRAYQRFLPADLRCEGENEPAEEEWAWDGHAVHLDRHEAPAAPVKLIALHGGGGHSRLVAAAGIAARPGAETVAPDLPGYGLTTVPRGRRTTYEDWVACTAALVRAERERDGRPVVLFGASMGGRLALDVAARDGEVAGVIATCLLDPRLPEVRRAVVRHPALAPAIPALLAAARALGGVRVPMPLVANIGAIGNPPGLAAACRADPRGGGNRVQLGFLASWLRAAPEVEPERFTTCPVLLAHPGDDRWTPLEPSAAYLERIAAPAELVELPGCGHFPVEEPGVRVLQEAMARFLSEAALTPR